MSGMQPHHSQGNGPLRVRARRGSRFASTLASRVLGQSSPSQPAELERITQHLDVVSDDARGIEPNLTNCAKGPRISAAQVVQKVSGRATHAQLLDTRDRLEWMSHRRRCSRFHFAYCKDTIFKDHDIQFAARASVIACHYRPPKGFVPRGHDRLSVSSARDA